MHKAAHPSHEGHRMIILNSTSAATMILLPFSETEPEEVENLKPDFWAELEIRGATISSYDLNRFI